MTDEQLEKSLQDEVGPPYVRRKLPTSSERYEVGTWIWSEWNRINHQIKNIPWWQFHKRYQARRKYNKFSAALDVLHHYVPARDEGSS